MILLATVVLVQKHIGQCKENGYELFYQHATGTSDLVSRNDHRSNSRCYYLRSAGADSQEKGMRGTICVERTVFGVPEWLPLAAQSSYREWTGCFSLIQGLTFDNTGIIVVELTHTDGASKW